MYKIILLFHSVLQNLCSWEMDFFGWSHMNSSCSCVLRTGMLIYYKLHMVKKSIESYGHFQSQKLFPQMYQFICKSSRRNVWHFTAICDLFYSPIWNFAIATKFLLKPYQDLSCCLYFSTQIQGYCIQTGHDCIYPEFFYFFMTILSSDLMLHNQCLAKPPAKPFCRDHSW